jgi:hypothetical protein
MANASEGSWIGGRVLQSVVCGPTFIAIGGSNAPVRVLIPARACENYLAKPANPLPARNAADRTAVQADNRARGRTAYVQRTIARGRRFGLVRISVSMLFAPVKTGDRKARQLDWLAGPPADALN